MGNKKVSIIVPVYNGEKYCGRCVKSLLAQSYGNTEILLIDDGSEDGSGDLCERLSAEYDRIKVFHIQNSGVSAARNKGIEEASGEYLTFVDVDDSLRTDAVERLLALAEKTGSDIAGCAYYFETGTEQKEAPFSDEKAECFTGSEFITNGILAGDTRCWSKLYLRRAIGKSRFDTSLSIGEDMLFLLELCMKGLCFSRTDYQGYGYFLNDEGAMQQVFRRSYMDQITCWQQASSRIVPLLPEAEKKVTAIRMVSVMLVAGKLAVLSGGERRKAGEYIERCREELRECRKIRGAFEELSAGYRLKVIIFESCPQGYLWLYHRWKRKH